jgi:hypothetical protein
VEQITDINNRPKHNGYAERNDRDKKVCMKEVVEENLIIFIIFHVVITEYNNNNNNNLKL